MTVWGRGKEEHNERRRPISLSHGSLSEPAYDFLDLSDIVTRQLEKIEIEIVVVVS